MLDPRSNAPEKSSGHLPVAQKLEASSTAALAGASSLATREVKDKGTERIWRPKPLFSPECRHLQLKYLNIEFAWRDKVQRFELIVTGLELSLLSALAVQVVWSSLLNRALWPSN